MDYLIRKLHRDDAQEIFRALRSRYGDSFPADISINTVAKRIEKKLGIREFQWIVVKNASNCCVGVASYMESQEKCFHVRYTSFCDEGAFSVPLSNKINSYIQSVTTSDCFIGYVVFGGMSEGWF